MILEALASRLVSASVATLAGDLFIGLMPDQPDLCCVLYEYSGQPPLEFMNDGGASIDRQSVQLMTRGGRNDYPTARALLIDARDALVSIANEDVNGLHFLRVMEMNSVNAIGNDDNDRPMFAVGLQAMVRR